MDTHADKALRCVACGSDFTFTAREQQFHAEKGFTNEPRRCLACRQARRGSGREAASAPLRPVRQADEGQPARSERHPDRSATSEPQRTYTAVCSACAGEAVLPYEPVGNRPVLCAACYDTIRATAR